MAWIAILVGSQRYPVAMAVEENAQQQAGSSLWPTVPRGGISAADQAEHLESLRRLADAGNTWSLREQMHRFAASNVLDRQDMAIAGRMSEADVRQAIIAVEQHNQELRTRAARQRFQRASALG